MVHVFTVSGNVQIFAYWMSATDSNVALVVALTRVWGLGDAEESKCRRWCVGQEDIQKAIAALANDTSRAATEIKTYLSLLVRA